MEENYRYGSFFDEDYFERGIETGKSLYTNYRWMPERSFAEAHDLILGLNIHKDHSILDFGCAKGFLIKALVLLGYDAYGTDISEYAIKNAEQAIKERVFLLDEFFVSTKRFNYGFCKDVLEHCPSDEILEKTLVNMNKLAKKWLLIVPLGDGEEYIIPLYSQDPSHFIKQTLEWWIDRISKYFKVIDRNYQMGKIKEKWFKINPRANLFLILEAKNEEK